MKAGVVFSVCLANIDVTGSVVLLLLSVFSEREEERERCTERHKKGSPTFFWLPPQPPCTDYQS